MDTVSLELAKKLKDGGWKQDLKENSSYWHADKWRPQVFLGGSMWLADSKVYNCDYHHGYCETEGVVAAPTIGELLEAFDHEVLSVTLESDFYDRSKRIVYRAHTHNYQDYQNESDVHGDESDSPADALALLWLELNKSSHPTLDQLNGK